MTIFIRALDVPNTALSSLVPFLKIWNLNYLISSHFLRWNKNSDRECGFYKMLRSTESLSEDARGYGGRPSAQITQSARRPSTVSTLSNENTYSGLISHI